ncbi:hypothetical protein CC78DRAFT_574423 [Lojkania enalia]|uniref:Uncharacterized protein n=1 Tax=Lojkania enalia TaxID=147567 RepID=A0A9P4NBR8_9PLEO|nr:hypothetical protein CC78DRAFT_574423 [Didymosphaeria enalia]
MASNFRPSQRPPAPITNNLVPYPTYNTYLLFSQSLARTCFAVYTSVSRYLGIAKVYLDCPDWQKSVKPSVHINKPGVSENTFTISHCSELRKHRASLALLKIELALRNMYGSNHKFTQYFNLRKTKASPSRAIRTVDLLHVPSGVYNTFTVPIGNGYNAIFSYNGMNNYRDHIVNPRDEKIAFFDPGPKATSP